MAQINLFDKKTAAKVALELLQTTAVKLRPSNPFQWASGWKSPIYCDNRLTLSFPKTRTFIKKQLSNVVKTHFSEIDGIIGVATAGIPQGALVAENLELPFLYVRSKPKGHGMGNQIEGKIDPKGKYVMIEDLVSTGKSSLQAAKEVEKTGATIVGMLAIFTYEFETATNAFIEANIPLYVLCDYTHLIEEAIKSKYVQADQLTLLSQWRKAPSSWSN